MELIKHHFHDHKLTFILRNEKNENDGKKNICKGCEQEILGSSYDCQECSNFHLHKICAELPQSIHRTVQRYGHKGHDLVLHERPPYQNFGYSIQCGECGQLCKAFIYHCDCPDCRYDICICCASREQIVRHKSHRHRLRPMLRPATFLCDACCTESKGLSYQCLNCRFWIHEDCASFPIIIKFQEHTHPLILSYSDSSPIKSFPGELSCGICKQNLNKKSWLYHCKPCGFFVHPTCLANIESVKVDNFDEASLMILPSDEETDRLLFKFVEQLSHQGNNNKETELNEEKINKFGYELTLKSGGKELSSNNKKCIACLFPISNHPFYSFRSDEFHDTFLHKWCAELPSELDHPGHPHKLNLNGSERKNFRCCNCQCDSEGFRFQCKECNNYCLDVRCASLPTVIKHKVHRHPLHLSEDCLSQHCVACNQKIDEFSFGCSICNINLHYTCALLPLEFKHRCDKHPFTLNYHSIKDEEECYCGICEDEIDPMWWFYDCKECRQYVCVRCMWEEKQPFPHIPNWVRTTYDYKTHSHPLHLMDPISSAVNCGLCSFPIYNEFAYRCEFNHCDKAFHRKCIKGYWSDPNATCSIL